MAKTIVCSYSELDSYRQCRLKHQFGYIERWRTETTSPALNRGKLFHQVIEQHYLMLRLQRRGELTDALYLQHVGAIRDLLHNPETGTQSADQELIEWMYQGYIECYGKDPRWKVLAVEHKIEEYLPTDRGGRSSIKLKGTIDLIVRDMEMGGLWIVDHKTCKNLPKGRELDLDDQFGLYQWLLRKRGNDIRGIWHNAVRTERLKTREMDMSERFKRTPTVRTERELDSIAVEAYQLLREAWTNGQNGRRVARSTNPDTCRWRCDYTEPCLAGRKGADMRSMLSGMGFVQDFERH